MKKFQITVTYVVCADSKEEAVRAVIMASSPVYKEMKTREIAHSWKGDEQDLFHAHDFKW